ncbi:MAG: carboxymuconolactone decarboxylase family protein [Ignavibacterium sp.]|uniref:carboxymuconolactone decarboxylase family protein n=1 Tax=Ignavibacterium sp. TaxID=2651167 RepID=UPI004049EAC1
MTSIELLSLITASAASGKIKYFDSFLNLSLQKRISKKKIYEALLQNYLFCGFPSALFFLKRFHHLCNYKPKNYKFNTVGLYEKGIKTSKKIYGDKLPKLISNVKKFSPELAEWLISEGYGKVISRKDLTIKERESCIISVLSVQRFEEQLVSHIYGGLKNNLTIKQISKLISNLTHIECYEEKEFGLNVLDKVINKKSEK